MLLLSEKPDQVVRQMQYEEAPDKQGRQTVSCPDCGADPSGRVGGTARHSIYSRQIITDHDISRHQCMEKHLPKSKHAVNTYMYGRA